MLKFKIAGNQAFEPQKYKHFLEENPTPGKVHTSVSFVHNFRFLLGKAQFNKVVLNSSAEDFAFMEMLRFIFVLVLFCHGKSVNILYNNGLINVSDALDCWAWLYFQLGLGCACKSLSLQVCSLVQIYLKNTPMCTCHTV